MIVSFNEFLDDVPANNTIWILGDALLTDAAGHYNAFKRKKGDTTTSEFQTLYIENMYAIRIVSSGVYTAKQAQNMPNIILNSLVDTLNMKAKVPHTLVIVLNDLRFWNNSDLITYQIERIIKRFVKELRRIVEARNLSLPPRAVNWDYPRIFLTKPLPLPDNMMKPYPKGFRANRKEYIKLLQQLEIELNFKTINFSEFTCENQNKLLAATDGSLTTLGYKNFWITMSDAIHKADNQDRITLNKAKAKLLAAQISITQTEMKELHGNEDNLSDIDIIPDEDESTDGERVTQHHTKRALIDEFNKSGDSWKQRHDNNKTMSGAHSTPQSAISEYYTVQGNQRRHHNTGPGRGRMHHPPFKGKKGFNRKNNWRLNKCHHK